MKIRLKRCTLDIGGLKINLLNAMVVLSFFVFAHYIESYIEFRYLPWNITRTLSHTEIIPALSKKLYAMSMVHTILICYNFYFIGLSLWRMYQVFLSGGIESLDSSWKLTTMYLGYTYIILLTAFSYYTIIDSDYFLMRWGAFSYHSWYLTFVMERMVKVFIFLFFIRLTIYLKRGWLHKLERKYYPQYFIDYEAFKKILFQKNERWEKVKK